MSDPIAYLDSTLSEFEPSVALPTQHAILRAQHASDEAEHLIELGDQIIHTFRTFDNFIQSTERPVTPFDVEDCGKGLRRLTEEVGIMDGLTERHLCLSAAKLLLYTLAGVLNRPGNIWDSYQGQRPPTMYTEPREPLRYKHLFLNLIGDLASTEEETRAQAYLMSDGLDEEQVYFVLDDLEKVLGDMEHDEDDGLSQMMDRIVQRLETLRASTPGATEGTIKEVVVRKIDEYIERLQMIGNQG